MRMKPGRPSGAGARRSPMLTWVACVLVQSAGARCSRCAGAGCTDAPRDGRQALVAGIAIHRQCPPHQVPGGRPRERPVQGVGVGQQRHIGGGEAADKAMRRRPIALVQRPRAGALDQPHQLRPRVAGGALQVAHHHPLVRSFEPGVAKPAQHALDMRSDPRPCPIAETRPPSCPQKRRNCGNVSNRSSFISITMLR